MISACVVWQRWADYIRTAGTPGTPRSVQRSLRSRRAGIAARHTALPAAAGPPPAAALALPPPAAQPRPPAQPAAGRGGYGSELGPREQLPKPWPGTPVSAWWPAGEWHGSGVWRASIWARVSTRSSFFTVLNEAVVPGGGLGCAHAVSLAAANGDAGGRSAGRWERSEASLSFQLPICGAQPWLQRLCELVDLPMSNEQLSTPKSQPFFTWS